MQLFDVFNTDTKVFDKPIVDFSKHTELFSWNSFLHFPVPTAKFVEEEMGIDLISHYGSDIQANKVLNQVAKMAKDYMFGRMPVTSKQYQEFRISRDLEVIKEVLQYQTAFIISVTTSGGVFDLYSVTKGEQSRPYIAGIENATAALTTKFRTMYYVPKALLYVGY